MKKLICIAEVKKGMKNFYCYRCGKEMKPVEDRICKAERNNKIK